jgi:hypothetical protein
MTMTRPSTKSAEVDRAARRTVNSADNVKSPQKHEKNVLLQSLVKHIEEQNLSKVMKVMKDQQAQYPWLNRGMLYPLMTLLDGLIAQII